MKPRAILTIILFVFCPVLFGQKDSFNESLDSALTKFDRFNQKAERLFKILPIPLYSYNPEAGHIFGLAKYNLFRLSSDDSSSQPSRLTGLTTFSTNGRVKVIIGADLLWNRNNYMLFNEVLYKKQDEYFFGFGNDVDFDTTEKFGFTQLKLVSTFYKRAYKNLYGGLGIDISDYSGLDYDSTSFLAQEDVTGTQPTTNFGLTLSALNDNRGNRYNPYSGSYFNLKYTFFPSFLGNSFIYQKAAIDGRKYYNPYLNHVIALQATSTYCHGNTPFYELALLGGDSRMRGYYEGALRDRVAVDWQVEYRMPIWNVFGAVAWLGAGQVGVDYNNLTLNGFWLTYGVGLRIRVDSENNTNLRFDFSLSNHAVNGFYVSLGEAF